MNSEQKVYFENLDGLRFVLAAAVFFSHSMIGNTLTEISPWNVLDRFILIFSTGSIAVSFFFVLSGYLITYLILEECKENGKFRLKNFYIRRVFRIWPLYYLVLMFSFFVYPFVKNLLGNPDVNPYNLLFQIFFLSNFDSIRVFNEGLVDVAPLMVNINWSIAIEEQFYLVWPLLFLLLPARKFAFAIIGVLAISIISQVFFLQGIEHYYHTLAVISDMAIGAIFGYLSFYSLTFVARIESMSRAAIVGIYLLGIMLLMYPMLLQQSVIPGRVIGAIFFCFVIVEQNFAKNSFYKFAHSRILTENGKYTFSFYLLHPIGIQAAILSFRFVGIDRSDNYVYAFLYPAIAFVVTAPLCFASYKYVESYLQLQRRKFFTRTV